jgi:integrase
VARGCRGWPALTRSGTPFRASTLAGYRRELRERVYPEFGDRRLDVVTRGDVLALIGGMQTEGLSPSTVRNVVVPLRSLYRYAADHDWTARNPTRGVAMPGVSGVRRERLATPAEVRALLDALEECDRALWATAAYAGLRRGELQGLRWSDVDLDARLIRVRQAYSQVAASFGPPKTAAGRREVPIAEALAPFLAGHRERSGADAEGLVFARASLAGTVRGNATAPFSDQTVGRRAAAAWQRAGLEPLGMHEARHAFASSLLAAGVPMQVVSKLMGHTTIQVTLDLYGHLLPNGRRDALRRLDDFLEGAA